MPVLLGLAILAHSIAAGATATLLPEIGSRGGVEVKPLSDYMWTEFKVYPVERLSTAEGNNGVIRLDEVRDRLVNLLYLVSPDPHSIAGNLSFKDRASYMGEYFYIFSGHYDKDEVLAIIGDEGDFLIKVGDGTTGAYMMCNLTGQQGRPPLSFLIPPNIMGLEFDGQYGESEALQKVGEICGNASTTCTQPENATVETVLINPYEVYHLELDGYKIEPPLRIRCTDPRYSGGLKAVYVEGFIPKLDINGEQNFILTKKRITEIVDLVRSAGVNVNSPDELTVKDIYLTLIPNQTLLVPVMVLAGRGTVIHVGLTPNKPIFLSAAGQMEGPSQEGSSNGYWVRLDWENIISNTTHEGPSGGEWKFYAPTIGLVAAVAAAVIVLLRARR
ncbi:MAG: hypothetical protein F7C35_02495 [Desulfurococcales archaeon]|nr:hypothetical protein [Desulfurococcales archaeon]